MYMGIVLNGGEVDLGMLEGDVKWLDPPTIMSFFKKRAYK